jgi:asparagine synthase (glutamine-hydrolysing)
LCGITGIFAFNLVGKLNKINVTAATHALSRRGPDFEDIHIEEWVCLGHRRLSILDTSEAGNQPMWDPTGRYAIVHNGEIFNFRELRSELEGKGVSFRSHSDTEVLLHLYIREGENCLNRLNGFFAFCIYDKAERLLFIARDRYGIKPLLYLMDEDKFLFASEMKSLIAYGIPKDLDADSILTYLQLNYIPAPHTVFRAVKKLEPGHFLRVREHELEMTRYYEIPFDRETAARNPISYEQACRELTHLMEASVQRRLVSDVPLGAFLSGGIDSSVVSALAVPHKPDLHTFSIGYKDYPYFDETAYARKVAAHLKTDHTVFSLSRDDLFAHYQSVLNYTDEPFADSSALPVYILSRETRKHATVALSGDGADELFGGYNKHTALLQSLDPGGRERVVGGLHYLWKALPRSRQSPLANTARQLLRFSEGMRLTPRERYWRWAGYATRVQAARLLHASLREQGEETDGQKAHALRYLSDRPDMNEVLRTDMHLVLPGDMLAKVDMMSMANGLEVRAPFLDYEVVNFAFGLPVEFKIDRTLRKKIVQDAFRGLLPAELYNRPKKGFELPLLPWLRSDLKQLITKELLADEFIMAQGIFDLKEIRRLRRQLFWFSPGDIHARIWALVVFQWWWKKFGKQ